MIGALFILNGRGYPLIQRAYRDDMDTKSLVSAFKNRLILSQKTNRGPVKTIGSTHFLFVQQAGIYYVAAAKNNVNATIVFQFLYKLIEIFKAYFDDDLSEENIKENFTLVYELLDEIIDFGYPQNCEPNILKTYITSKGLKQDIKPAEITEIMKGVTGAVNWRNPGIKYRKNEVFIDVIEDVNMLMSPEGKVLNSDVSGKIIMKAFLTGMPECKFGLNDKLMMEAEHRKATGTRYKEIDIDDVTFHQCVKLGKFDSDRTISFIPLDGQFELMRYRITNNVVPPFKLLSPIVREVGKTKLEVEVTAKSNFDNKIFAKNVVITIPLPSNTANVHIHQTSGKGKYKSENQAIIWTIKRFAGQTVMKISAEVELLQTTVETGKKWSKPPISMQFSVPMFTASGIHVRFLKVVEKKFRYNTTKWVRYITQAGSYDQRITP